MLNWRAKVGLLVPSRNLTVETDFNILKPVGVSVHSSRIWRESADVTIESQHELVQNAKTAARTFFDAHMDIIVFACTSASFLGGREFEMKLIKDLEQTAGTRCISTSHAVTEALKSLDIKRILIITPYIDEINQKEREYFASSGFEIVDLHSLNLRTAGINYASISPYTIYSFTKKAALSCFDYDAIFISCTNIAALTVIKYLETDLNKPVITSNQATFWYTMKKLNINASLQNYGRLLENMK